MKKINLFLSLLAFSSLANAWQISNGDFTTWQKALRIEPSVAIEMNNFFIQNSIQSSSSLLYSQQFPQVMKSKVFTEAQSALAVVEQSTAQCPKFSNVQFPGQLTSQSDPQISTLAAAFETEILRVETLDCLGRLDLEKVFNVFMSSEFQKKSINGLKAVTADQSTNQVCQQTSIFGLGNSSYCFIQKIWKDSDTIVIHSFNESNKPSVSAPVYFREVITVFKRTQQNEILVYNLAYGRGPNLPLHGYVKSTVQKQQARLIELLIEASGP